MALFPTSGFSTVAAIQNIQCRQCKMLAEYEWLSTNSRRCHFALPEVRSTTAFSSSSLSSDTAMQCNAPTHINHQYCPHLATPKSGVYTVGDFMTKKELLHAVKPTTTIDEALELLVENRITGFPVIDDDWKLVGLVSDYDLLALDSVSGTGVAETSMFPEADSSWKTFNEIQKLLSKTNGKVVADVMTPAPLVVRETTNLEDAARLLLETKYRRLPVVDSKGKLVGIITRGNVVRAALHIKKEIEKNSQ
ncbi:CBS domain-containing protein cbsx1 [Ranunculus cassubicifolius]